MANLKSIKIGKRGIVFMTILALIITFFSPLLPFFISKIPERYIKSMLKDVYNEKIFIDTTTLIDTPRKFESAAPLPVLGQNSGICLSFASTEEKEDKSILSAQHIDRARRGKPIAEIIAVSTENNTEYKLEHMSVNIGTNKNNEPFTVICQKFGRKYSTAPETIRAIYMRPLEPFTPFKIIWASAKNFNNDLLPKLD